MFVLLAAIAGSALFQACFPSLVYNAAKTLLGIKGTWLINRPFRFRCDSHEHHRDEFGQIEVISAGATGVVATLLLAVCFLKLRSVD